MKNNYLVHLVLMYDNYKHKHISIIREYSEITEKTVLNLMTEFMLKENSLIKPISVCVCGFQKLD